jgi:acyl-CoA thioesterase FadM
MLWRDVWKRNPDPPFVVAEAAVRFASSAMIGDPLQIDITTESVGTKSWVWKFVITDALEIPDDVRLLLESGRA